MTSEQEQRFKERLADVAFARWLYALAAKPPRGTTSATELRLMALAEQIHAKVCIEGCSLEEYRKAATSAVQAESQYGESRLMELPDDPTPTETPRAKRRLFWPW